MVTTKHAFIHSFIAFIAAAKEKEEKGRESIQ
jgi:hypothetical protein